MTALLTLLGPVLVALIKVFLDRATNPAQGSVSNAGDVGRRMRHRLRNRGASRRTGDSLRVGGWPDPGTSGESIREVDRVYGENHSSRLGLSRPGEE